MSRKCCLPACKSEGKDIKLHKMPINNNKLSQWMKVLSQVPLATFESLNRKEIGRLFVCHKHFEAKFITENMRLINSACPTLFTPEEISSGIPSRTYEAIETMAYNRSNDHTYTRKPHYDHTYVKSRPESPNILRKDAATITGNTNLMGNPDNPGTNTETPEILPQAGSGAQTPKKICRRRLIQSFNSLTPKCKMLYTHYKKARKQLDFRCRAKMATQLSKEESFNNLTKDMNSTSRKFLWMQVKLCTKSKKGRRFTTDEKLIALSIMKQSPKCYRFLQRIFILPSKTTLNKLIENLNIEAGVNSQIFNVLKQEVRDWNEHKKMCTIIFDEMSLETGITYTKKKDKINGFVELTQKTANFADHALTFMIKGAIHKWQQPIAFYFSEGAASGQQVKAILKQIVKAVSDTGLTPIALVSDQGASFQNALKSLQEDTRRFQILAGEETDGAIHLNGHVISVIYDPPHLIKGVRNNFLTKDVIMGGGERATWKDIVDVYTTDCRHAQARLLHKLNDEHVIPDKIKKMKVRNCVRVFSKTVAAALSYTASFSHYVDGKPVSKTLENTAKLVSFLDDLFDSVNGASLCHKDTKGKHLRKAVTEDSAHHTFWNEAVNKINSIQFIDQNGKLTSVPTLKNWITTLNSYRRLWQYLKNKNVKVMRPRYYNSDSVENFFGRVRAYNSRNNDPSCHAFVSTFKSLLVTSFIKFHQKSFNCEDDAGSHLVKMQSLFKQFEDDLTENQNELNNATQSVDIVISNEIANENIQVQAARERLNVHSRAYTVGWVTRKILTKLNCRKCADDFTVNEDSTTHKWISQREYNTIKLRKLSYPSEHAVRHFGNILTASNEFLEQNAHKISILRRIKDNVLEKYTFDFIKCERHRDTALECFLTISIKLCIFNWCNTINKILRGTDVARLVESNLPYMQAQAFRKYKKRFKNKRLIK